MIGTAALHKAVSKVWDYSSLDGRFKDLWGSSVTASEFPVLHDQEAGPGQPFPYCVFEQSVGSTIDRMSGGVSALREIRDIPWSFHIHAKRISADPRSAKEIAAELAEDVMKEFGGHPTVKAQDLVIDIGNVLVNQYQGDYGVRTGEEEYQWIVNYVFKIDVPVAV